MVFKIGSNTVVSNTAGFIHSSFESVSANLQNTNSRIYANDGAAGDMFGHSCSIGNGRMVVGAPYDDDNGSDSGSAYIYNLNGSLIAKIKPSDGAANGNFPVVSAVDNGRIIGTTSQSSNGTSGSVYVFDLNGTQLNKFTASGSNSTRFGESIDIGNDVIVAGAWADADNGLDAGAAYIFSLSGTQIAKIKPSDGTTNDQFGHSVAVGNGRVVVGSLFDDDNGTDSGSAYIFDLKGNQIAKIKPSDGAASDYFGYAVAVGCGRIVVCAPTSTYGAGKMYIFDLNGKQLVKVDQQLDGYRALSIGHGRIIVADVYATLKVYDLNGNLLASVIHSPSYTGSGNEDAAIGCGRIVYGDRLNDVLGTDAGSVIYFSLPEDHNIYFDKILDSYKF